MNERKRVEKDLEMLKALLEYLKSTKLAEKYKEIIQWSENYYKDGEYYLKKGDYFTAFGCANYGYGMLDAILLLEGIKEKVLRERGL